MGTPNTTNTVDVVDSGLLLTAQELVKFEGIGGENGAHPSKLFGSDWDKENAPPHVKSYGVVGSALYGQPLDSWARFGAYDAKQRKPEFRSFSAITEGLPLDERVRFAIILIQYLKDISTVSQRKKNIFELETLAHAREWVGILIQTADPETRSELAKMGDPTIQQYFPVPAAEQPAPVEAVASPQASVSAPEVVAPVVSIGMRERFQRLFKGTVLEKLFS